MKYENNVNGVISSAKMVINISVSGLSGGNGNGGGYING
jgi:hypothetical protein